MDTEEIEICSRCKTNKAEGYSDLCPTCQKMPSYIMADGYAVMSAQRQYKRYCERAGPAAIPENVYVSRLIVHGVVQDQIGKVLCDKCGVGTPLEGPCMDDLKRILCYKCWTDYNDGNTPEPNTSRRKMYYCDDCDSAMEDISMHDANHTIRNITGDTY